MASKNGTIRKIKTGKNKGKYQAIWQFSSCQTEQIGKKSISKVVSSKNAAQNWLNEQKALYGNNSSFNQYLTLNIIYTKAYFPKRLTSVDLSNIRSSTVDRENQVFRSHLKKSELGNTPLKDLNADIINSFLSNKLLNEHYSYSEIYKHLYSLIESLLKFAYSKDWLKRPIYEQIEKASKANKPPKEIKPYTKAEMSLLYKTSQELWSNKKQGRINLGYFLLAYTGMRVGEMLDLKWSDIYIDKREAIIDSTYSTQKDFKTGKRSYISGTPKTKSSNRIIGLNDNALDILKEIKTRNIEAEIFSDYIICNNKGEQIGRSTFRRTVERLVEKSKLHKTNDLLHSARHFYINELRSLGTPEYIISAMVGHSSTASTKPYLHTNTNEMANKMKCLNITLNNNAPKTDLNSSTVKNSNNQRNGTIKAVMPNKSQNRGDNGNVINISDYITA